MSTFKSMTLAIHPRVVKTDAGNDAARAADYLSTFVAVKDSVNAAVAKIDGLAKESGAGEFWGFDDAVTRTTGLLLEKQRAT